MPIYDKVATGGYAGLVSTLLVGVLGLFGVTLPAAAVAAIVTLVIFAAGYLKSETKVGADVAKVAEALLSDMEAEGPVKP